MSIGHFVITLFNLRLKWVGRERKLTEIDTAIDVNYLENSFKRFETYAVPSIRNQTKKNIKWLVLFSQDTPIEYVKRMNNIRNSMGGIDTAVLNG